MDKTLLFIYLVLFPFGQLLRKTFNFFGFDIALNASDLVAGLIFLYTLFQREEKAKLFLIFKNFVFAASFSFLVSIFFFKSPILVVGFLYLLRIVIYLYFLQFSFTLTKKYEGMKELLFNSLIALSLMVSIFGWIQYFIYPDLTALKYVGWDDHLFRLVGTFLDPGYTSLIIALGGILSFFKYSKEGKKAFLFLLGFFVFTLAFTYSRAGYISFLAAILLSGFLVKKLRLIIITILFFGLVVFLLPKPAGEGVNLARTYSITQRVENYKETIQIFLKSPVLGIGFNNICLARSKYFNDTDTLSHSCSGSDSSLLLILASTGVVGLIIFLNSLWEVFKTLERSFYFNVLLVSSVALFIHSFFANSLFYPFILGYFAILALLAEV